MDTFEIIILSIFIIGVGLLLYLILQDPTLMIKSFFRGLISTWRLKIIFFPIWGPIWVIDKIFQLKIYISDFDDASVSIPIIFKDYKKYILVSTNDKSSIENIIASFQKDFDNKEFNYDLNGAIIKISEIDKSIVLKIDLGIDFKSFKMLINYIDNSAHQDRAYNVKGILLNQCNYNESFFVFKDTAYKLKLIGKTFKNKKIYLDISQENESKEVIYFNSNIDYFSNFNFKKFEYETDHTFFDNINVLPST